MHLHFFECVLHVVVCLLHIPDQTNVEKKKRKDMPSSALLTSM